MQNIPNLYLISTMHCIYGGYIFLLQQLREPVRIYAPNYVLNQIVPAYDPAYDPAIAQQGMLQHLLFLYYVVCFVTFWVKLTY